MCWSQFGTVEILPLDSQIGQAYKIVSDMMPELTAWQAARKVDALLVTEGEQGKSLSLGGYSITLSREAGFPGGSLAANASGSPGSATPKADTRPFAIVVNTAPNELLFVGANGVPKFTVNSPGPSHVAIVSKQEGYFERGQWIPGRRLNDDEAADGRPGSRIGLLEID